MNAEPQRTVRIRTIAHRLWELEGSPEGRTETHWQQATLIEAEQAAQAQQIVYVLDRDLVRFLKFAASIIAVMLTAGAIFWGVDLKRTTNDIEAVRKTVEADRAASAKILQEVVKIESNTKDEIARGRAEIDAAVQQAHGHLGEIAKNLADSRKYVTEQGVVVNVMRLEIREQVKRQITTLKVRGGGEELSLVVPVDSEIQPTKDELLSLVKQDIAKALGFFRKYDLAATSIDVEIKAKYSNIYYGEKKIVFGTEMVNGSIFGPYDSTIVYHEVAHSLLRITFQGQSGAVMESICDVLSVLIEGNRWTIGNVKTDNPGVSQFLHSLSAPGTAYDNSVLGKDPQPDHMSKFVHMPDTVEGDLGGVHVNMGILNKAAYLMSEGGTHHGVTISKGLGRDKLAQLYAAVIKSLPENKAVDFAAFKGFVIRAAESLFPDRADREIVAQSFAAVGL